MQRDGGQAQAYRQRQLICERSTTVSTETGFGTASPALPTLIASLAGSVVRRGARALTAGVAEPTWSLWPVSSNSPDFDR